MKFEKKGVDLEEQDERRNLKELKSTSEGRN